MRNPFAYGAKLTVRAAIGPDVSGTIEARWGDDKNPTCIIRTDEGRLVTVRTATGGVITTPRRPDALPLARAIVSGQDPCLPVNTQLRILAAALVLDEHAGQGRRGPKTKREAAE